jgi:hypothetical protein
VGWFPAWHVRRSDGAGRTGVLYAA